MLAQYHFTNGSHSISQYSLYFTSFCSVYCNAEFSDGALGAKQLKNFYVNDVRQIS